MSNPLKYKRIFTSSSGTGGMTPSELTRLQTLENNELKITYFTEISTATGTITIPTGATIILDEFSGGVDAYVSVIANNRPTGVFPQTAAFVEVDVTSFDALGNYTLSGTPQPTPVALIYILKIDAKDYSNLVVDNILDMETMIIGNRSGEIPSIGIDLGNSLIVATDSNKKLQTLPTATYPSLTELSYIKGLTGSVGNAATKNVGTTAGTVAEGDDTRFNTTYHFITGSQSVFSPADSATNYVGIVLTLTPNASSATRQFQLPTGTLISSMLFVDPTATLGSNEAVSYYLRNITDATSTLLGTITYDARGNQTFYTNSISTNSSKLYSIEIVNPAWVTNPTNVVTYCSFRVRV